MSKIQRKGNHRIHGIHTELTDGKKKNHSVNSVRILSILWLPLSFILYPVSPITPSTTRITIETAKPFLCR